MHYYVTLNIHLFIRTNFTTFRCPPFSLSLSIRFAYIKLINSILLGKVIEMQSAQRKRAGKRANNALQQWGAKNDFDLLLCYGNQTEMFVFVYVCVCLIFSQTKCEWSKLEIQVAFALLFRNMNTSNHE